MIDITKLGYSQYKLYFKFQNTTIEKENQIIDYWLKDNSSVWVGQIRGPWDLAVSILEKNNYDFGQTLTKFMQKFSQYILQKDVLLTEYSPMYSREYLTGRANEQSEFINKTPPQTQASNLRGQENYLKGPKEFLYGIPSQTYELNETDKKILSELSNNARIPILKLADLTHLSRDIINYRIKKLTKENIIVQYRTYLNLENLNIRHYKVIFRMKNFSPQEEEKIKDYVKKHEKATQLLKLIGSYDLEIEFEVQDEDELYKILHNLRQKFSSIIRDFDIIRIIKTHKLDFFPF
ncbi:MAG: Lrp/AsnC family transcriptional regulator [Nanoarchaeota archaeon]|nr:Lrp/AsnC family transcriptional regulator [Nanoarchaeota archaeon]MBU1051835.1 Lrp/AsnC family transcriptional regulator [Nanoarchaeota archaeon]MBU1988434.1 Lrp/AsnC family transcriptional regulator [Nanoarchaeota archaeon]